MTPYDSLLFFYISGALLIVAAILGLLQKRGKPYGLAVTVIMLALIFDSWEKRLFLLGFFVFELLLALIYLKTRKKRKNWVVAWVFVLLSIAPLIFSKLSGFLPTGIWGILGISYITFRSVQVLIESYDGLIERLDIVDYAYFLLFFPTISSGPIDRYRRFKTDADSIPSREQYVKLLREGVWKLMSGVFYALVLGNIINTLWLSKIEGGGFFNGVSYMFAYTFFLFFNFAGYSRMAMGTGYILGIKVPENFDMPFIARDMKDFWSRWHISLSTWFRDYIYSRFTALTLRKHLFKNVYLGSYLGYILTMTVMGFWHGFGLNTIAYGLYHGLLMCLNDVLDNKWKKFKKLKKNEKIRPVFTLVTFLLVCFGMLIFSGYLF